MDLDKPPTAKTPAGEVLLREWHAMKSARDWHIAQGKKGDVEALIARLKMAWLKGLIYEVDAASPLTPSSSERTEPKQSRSASKAT
jgi:hypothetical protein